jgi:hypothetical protein
MAGKYAMDAEATSHTLQSDFSKTNEREKSKRGRITPLF